MRRKRYGKKKFYLSIIVGLLTSIGIGYSYLSSTLSINGNITVSKNSWDVHFENVVVNEGSANATSVPTLSNNNTKVVASVSLDVPGSFYEFTVDVVNNGSIDAMLSNIVSTSLTEEQKKYLEYSVSYVDGVQFNNNDLLAAGSKDTISVRVKYRDDVSEDDYPDSDQSFTITLETTYIQADSNAKEREKLVCKRATVLHEETCIDGSCIDNGFAINSPIVYGGLGTDGTLTSGDAFDCDVNGDGTYDSTTERFYYVSDLDTNSNYAVLIYYSNVAGGVPSNSTTFAYNTDISAYLGPKTIMLELPTISQWKNVSLANTTRDIKDEQGTVRVDGFSYAGYSARLLTTQEIEKACNVEVGDSLLKGETNNCNYLLENTNYSSLNLVVGGYRLETVCYYDFSDSYVLDGASSLLDISNTIVASEYGCGYGNRPVIEVPKSAILY